MTNVTNALSSKTQRGHAPTPDWNPITADQRPIPIKKGSRLWWRDLTGAHAPRWVTVHHFDHDNDLLVCTDDTNTNYMAMPGELTQTQPHSESVRKSIRTRKGEHR